MHAKVSKSFKNFRYTFSFYSSLTSLRNLIDANYHNPGIITKNNRILHIYTLNNSQNDNTKQKNFFSKRNA